MCIYKDINNFPNYEISDSGKVRNKKTGLILKTFRDRGGYERIRLNKCNRAYTKCIHRLVAGSFLYDYSEQLDVDHIDRDKMNNNVCNLRMLTHLQNLEHRFSPRLLHIKHIISLYEEGMSPEQILASLNENVTLNT